MYKLGYIKGYDSFNTMSFSSITVQSNYFDNCVIASIDAYYPPYYQNTIRLSISDVNYTTSKFNFLYLIHSNKRYYYFIDNIAYVNEDIFEIHIIMDTIQTFMFDFTIENAIKTKESINRWNNNKINRNYIRENLSQGVFEPKEFNYTGNRLYLFVKTTKSFGDIEDSPTTINYETNVSYVASLKSGEYVYFYPVPTIELTGSSLRLDKVYLNGTQILSNKTLTLRPAIESLLRNPYVTQIFMGYSEQIDHLFSPRWVIEHEYDEEGVIIDDYNTLHIDTINLKSRVADAYFKLENSDTYEPLFLISGIDNSFTKLDYNTIKLDTNDTFTKNTSISQPFNKRYIPQLLDENYIQISYGEKIGATSYPVHQLEKDAISRYNILDIIEGSRVYKICEYNGLFNDIDIFNTTKAVSSLESFNLINDAWETYQATHKGSLTTGLQLQMVNSIYKFAKGQAGASASTSMNYAMANSSGIGPGQAMYFNSSAMQSQIRGATAKTDFAMDMANIVANYQITKENLEYTPDVIGQGSVLFADLQAHSFRPFYSRQQVNDIEAVARRLEYYGYTVNKVVENVTINSDNIRYYYNVKRYTNITIVNSGSGMISLEFMKDIVDRLEKGIRMFNVVRNNTYDTNFIGNLQYDNVELG